MFQGPIWLIWDEPPNPPNDRRVRQEKHWLFCASLKKVPVPSLTPLLPPNWIHWIHDFSMVFPPFPVPFFAQGIDVKYAEGHRLAQRSLEGFCFGSCGKTLDGPFARTTGLVELQWQICFGFLGESVLNRYNKGLMNQAAHTTLCWHVDSSTLFNIHRSCVSLSPIESVVTFQSQRGDILKWYQV